jgi:hypothetical protein
MGMPASGKSFDVLVTLCRRACRNHAKLLHHRQHVDDSPVLTHETILVEPHDVDELLAPITAPLATGPPVRHLTRSSHSRCGRLRQSG